MTFDERMAEIAAWHERGRTRMPECGTDSFELLGELLSLIPRLQRAARLEALKECHEVAYGSTRREIEIMIIDAENESTSFASGPPGQVGRRVTTDGQGTTARKSEKECEK